MSGLGWPGRGRRGAHGSGTGPAGPVAAPQSRRWRRRWPTPVAPHLAARVADLGATAATPEREVARKISPGAAPVADLGATAATPEREAGTKISPEAAPVADLGATAATPERERGTKIEPEPRPAPPAAPAPEPAPEPAPAPPAPAPEPADVLPPVERIRAVLRDEAPATEARPATRTSRSASRPPPPSGR